MWALRLAGVAAMTAASAGAVHIVDDDAGLRAALIRLVRSDGLEALGHADAEDLRSALADDVPSCVILDMRLERESGLVVQQGLRADGHLAPVIFLTGYGTIPMSVQAMRGGATEFLTKPVDSVALLSAVRNALELDRCAVSQRRRLGELDQRLKTLTSREEEVMRLAIGGLMNKQIAGEIGTTEITVKVHKRRVMEKMQARSLPDLVRMAEMLGIKAIRTR